MELKKIKNQENHKPHVCCVNGAARKFEYQAKMQGDCKQVWQIRDTAVSVHVRIQVYNC